MIRCKFSVYTLTAHWASSTKSESALKNATPTAGLETLIAGSPYLRQSSKTLQPTRYNLALGNPSKTPPHNQSQSELRKHVTRTMQQQLISRGELDASEKQVLQEDVPCMTGWGTASRHKKSTNFAAPRVGQPSVTGGRAWGKNSWTALE